MFTRPSQWSVSCGKCNQPTHTYRNPVKIFLTIKMYYYNSGHNPSFVFYSKQNVSETGYCVRLQVEPTELDRDRTGPGWRKRLAISTGTTWIGSA
jgi:hypothetical protein